ncbi:MAG TPA: YqhA family protein [Xanthobacteraceae bacterium]|nr:YqhA family protein [Xanthobacteraceae bacterium]
MAWPDGRYIQGSIFFSRWLVAPFLLGLLCCQFVLMYRFVGDFYALVIELPRSNWHAVITNVLNLVDIALTANLVLIVIFSSYENFIRRINAAEHPDWPEGLTQVNFGELKQRLLGSIVGISAVDALAWYFDIEKISDTSRLMWVLAFPVVFAAVMLMLAIADRLTRRADRGVR